MLDATLRPLKDRTVRPLARALAGRVQPVTITALSLGSGLAVAGLCAYRLYLPALALWGVSRLLDGLDGVLARLQSRATDLGGYLDLMADFAVYAAIPLGLVIGRPADAGLALAAAFMLASFYLNAAAWMYVSAVLEKRGRGVAATTEQTAVTMPRGLIEGTETILFYCAFLLFPGRLTELFAVFGGLVLAGMILRVGWGVRALR